MLSVPRTTSLSSQTLASVRMTFVQVKIGSSGQVLTEVESLARRLEASNKQALG